MKIYYIGLFVIGIVLGVAATLLLNPSFDGMEYSAAAVKQQAGEQPDASEPLYWVAPMDSNYRRDQPGKSPMGMDLVPVYADNSSQSTGAGVVQISPAVINNLGVRTQPVKQGQLQPQVTAVGLVRYDEDEITHIHPRVEGWVEKLYVKAAGDQVEQGQPLYDLYSPEMVNAQEELILALLRNDKRLIQSVENRLRALHVSAAQIQQVKKTRTALQAITYFAPRSGVVDNLQIREGFFIEPSTTIMSVASLDRVWVEADVFERDAPWVSLEQPVRMSVDYLPQREWLGKVDYVYPTLDANTRTVRLRLRFDNADHALKPNMYSRVDITAKQPLPQSQQPLLVPRSAVIRTGDQQRVVLALGDGHFKSVAVTLGASDREFMAVESGLSVGDTVVTSAQFLLDSESSKTSDFMRYTDPKGDTADHNSIHHDSTHNRPMHHDTEKHHTNDHGTMDHSDMNHSNVNHDEMNHRAMNHSEMDHGSMQHNAKSHANTDEVAP